MPPRTFQLVPFKTADFVALLVSLAEALFAVQGRAPRAHTPVQFDEPPRTAPATMSSCGRVHWRIVGAPPATFAANILRGCAQTNSTAAANGGQARRPPKGVNLMRPRGCPALQPRAPLGVPVLWAALSRAS